MPHRSALIGIVSLASAGAVLCGAAATGSAAWWVAGVCVALLIVAAASGVHAVRRADRAGRHAERALRRAAEAGGVHGSALSPEVAAARIASALTEARGDSSSLRSILDAMDEPVVACDADLTITLANRAAALLLAPGSSRPVVGEPLGQLLTEARALGVAVEARHGTSSSTQARLLTGQGPRIVEVAAEPIGATGTPGTRSAVVLTLRDVTEQATAMQLKTDFVANASHELRTPLASIRTAAETLMGLGEGGAAMRARLVSMIATNAERLEELSRDLLDLSRLESAETHAEYETVDLHAVSARIRELFAGPCAQRRITLEFELPPEFSRFRTDEKLLRLVVRNLIDNAIKFAYEDTAVRVLGEVLAETDTQGRRSARLEVIDRGIGIPLSQQQRVFERFFQVDEARTGPVRRRGTGLGLAIVKHALRALGGTISVESVWQQGTTMSVTLPSSVEPGEPDAP